MPPHDPHESSTDISFDTNTLIGINIHSRTSVYFFALSIIISIGIGASRLGARLCARLSTELYARLCARPCAGLNAKS